MTNYWVSLHKDKLKLMAAQFENTPQEIVSDVEETQEQLLFL